MVYEHYCKMCHRQCRSLAPPPTSLLNLASHIWVYRKDSYIVINHILHTHTHTQMHIHTHTHTLSLSHSLTHSLTPWCRVLLEKLTGLQLVKKFPAFHGTRRFITSLTSVRHLSLSWASPIQSIYPHPIS